MLLRSALELDMSDDDLAAFMYVIMMM